MSRHLERVRLKNDDLEDATDEEIVQFLVEHWIQSWEEERESLAQQRKRAREITGTTGEGSDKTVHRSAEPVDQEEVDRKFRSGK